MNKGVSLRALAADATEAVIDIVGVIGWEAGYQQLKAVIESIPATVKSVVFEIYSPGGDVWEGNGIVQAIGELGKRAETVARIQVAASMATLIACACTKRTIAANGRFLVHNAWTETVGDAAEHEKAAKTLRDCELEAARFYAGRTGKTEAEMLALMAEERWLLPEEAKQFGFIHEVCDPFKPEDFAAVRQEIEAAGKWPKSLVDLPVVEAVKEVVNAPIEQPAASQPVQANEPPAPELSEDEKLKAEYELGFNAGIAHAGAMSDRIKELEAKLAVAEREARLNQAAKDKLADQMKAASASWDVRADAFKRTIGEMAERMSRLVAGSLEFHPSVETWADALRSCGNDYAKAAKAYPDLLKQYRANARKG